MDIVERLEMYCQLMQRGDALGSHKADMLFEAAVEIKRLRGMIEDQQSHGEIYGRRSGGAKEVLFK